MRKMFDYKYLSREHLEGFDNYKYKCQDTSPLSVYIMHPFWNKVVEYVPRWVAANVLTFAGFLFTVADFVILSYYDYSFLATSLSSVENDTGDTLNAVSGEPGLVVDIAVHEVIPRWTWFVMSWFIFLAYTLDGIDGKQARRTQTSGPLGELFDHGLDSYSVFFIPVCLYSVFGRLDHSASPLRMYFIVWNMMILFFLSHWEKYNTGVLFLPWGYDFSMWGAVIVFFITGVYSPLIWKASLPFGLTAAGIFEASVYGTGLFTSLPVIIWNVYKSYKYRTGKMRTFTEAVRPLWSLLTVFFVSTLWIVKSPNNIVEKDPRMVYLLAGTLFSNLSCRLIVSQMSGTRCALLCWLLWPLIGCTVSSLLAPSTEIICLYAFTTLAVLAHLHYGTCVVRQMCEHFRITCFVIKKRSD